MGISPLKKLKIPNFYCSDRGKKIARSLRNYNFTYFLTHNPLQNFLIYSTAESHFVCKLLQSKYPLVSD